MHNKDLSDKRSSNPSFSEASFASSNEIPKSRQILLRLTQHKERSSINSSGSTSICSSTYFFEDKSYENILQKQHSNNSSPIKVNNSIEGEGEVETITKRINRAGSLDESCIKSPKKPSLFHIQLTKKSQNFTKKETQTTKTNLNKIVNSSDPSITNDIKNCNEQGLTSLENTKAILNQENKSKEERNAKRKELKKKSTGCSFFKFSCK